MPLLGNDVGGHPLNGVVILKVALAALGVGKLMHKVLEHHGARVAQGIDRVAHAVDQALAVEGFPVHDLAQVIVHGALVGGVGHVLAHVVHHLHDLDVRAAVLGAFQAAQRRRHYRVCIRPGGSHHAGGKGGVVAAAVFHVQQQRNIQYVCFQVGVLLVGAQHLQQVFGGGKFRPRAVDVHAAVALIVVVGVVAVDRQHREHADQLDALFQLGLQVGLADVVVIAGQRQHAARQRVHQVVAGRFHDNVAHKVGGQVAALHQAVLEGLKLVFIGQVAQQKQVGRFLKGVAFAAQAADQVVHIVAAVPQLAVAGDFLAVPVLERINAGNIRDARQHALAVLVAQAPFDVVLGEQRRFHTVVVHAFLCKNTRFFFNGCIITH